MMHRIVAFFRRYPWIISMIILAILIIPAARAHELWGDEAETALFARNILKYGVPKGWDGTNIMGINNAVVLDKNLINHTSPWAQYYMVAASFALFGQSSVTARIPSILLSLVSIPLLYYLARKLTGNTRMAFIATLIAALSVQGILFGYQARYYQLTNVCGLLFLWASVELLERCFWPRIGFVLSGVIFYYANYVSWTVFYVATLIGVGIFIWIKKGKANVIPFLREYFILTIPIIVLAAPWHVIMHPFGDRGTVSLFPLSDTFISFIYLLKEAWRPFHTVGAFPLGLGIVLGVISIVQLKKRTLDPVLVLLTSVPVLYVTGMSIVATIAYVDTTFSHPRYTTVALPLFFLLAAYAWDRVLHWNRWVGIMCIALFLTTTLFSFGALRSYLSLLIHEIIAPYQTPEIVVAQYLKDHAKRGDTAFVSLDRDHEPLIFHLHDHIRFVNRVPLINSRIFPQNRGVIPRYIYDFRSEPDWIVMYSKRGEDGTFFTSDFRGLWPEVDLGDYVEHALPIFFSDLSRPEIEMRSFTGVTSPAPIDYVYIYKKK